MYLVDEETYLMHYGVKGMKWGVRKDRYDETLSRDYVVKKGTSVQNISSGKQEGRGDRLIYGALTERDKAQYRGMFAMFKADPHVNQYIVDKDIRIPSQKRAVELFQKMIREDPKSAVESIAKARAEVTLLGNVGKCLKMDYASRLTRKFQSKGSDWVQTKGYELFNQSFFAYKESKFRDQYVSRLQKLGYDAMTDVNDMNNGYKSDKPIILFPKSTKYHLDSSVPLTETEMQKAWDYYAKHEKDKRKLE